GAVGGEEGLEPVDAGAHQGRDLDDLDVEPRLEGDVAVLVGRGRGPVHVQVLVPVAGLVDDVQPAGDGDGVGAAEDDAQVERLVLPLPRRGHEPVDQDLVLDVVPGRDDVDRHVLRPGRGQRRV